MTPEENLRQRRQLEQLHRDRAPREPLATTKTEAKPRRAGAEPTADEIVLALMLDFAASREQVVDWIVSAAVDLL